MLNWGSFGIDFNSMDFVECHHLLTFVPSAVRGQRAYNAVAADAAGVRGMVHPTRLNAAAV